MTKVNRIVMTITVDSDVTGAAGSLILTREPGSATVGLEYEPSIGDAARVIANAIIQTGILDRE